MDMPARLRSLADRYGSMALNLYLAGNCVVFGAYSVWQGYRLYLEGRLDYIEAAFIAQNLVLQNAVLIPAFLLRMRSREIDRNPFHQLVAVVAFFSGVAFIGQPLTGGGTAVMVSRAVIFAANILGLLALIYLGRSFGILIALRRVRTGGPYRVVRHPMYVTDILLRIGFLISHLNPVTVAVFVVSTAAYAYRAVLEERFLLRDPEYAEYASRVKYRFIPFVF